MASVSGQPQFRYTQPPSKVLHLRNLPWECTEEELIELGKPFGRIVNTKCNVGANRNQAFIEFAELNQAIAMISYYASSPEPAQVRGKTVYIQYSNRQEIVHNKTSGDAASNVLLVTIVGVDAANVSIDVLHLALIQFSNTETATAAKNALDGRSIPRDYTNPYLPVAPSAIDANAQFIVGPDGKRQEAESNVLLASIENMQYAVTADVLHTTASVAKEALEGHCIYDGGYCKLHLTYSRHTDLNVKANNDKSRDYTNHSATVVQTQPSILGQQPVSPIGMTASQLPNYGFAPSSERGMGPSPVGNWDMGGQASMVPLPAHIPANMNIPANLPVPLHNQVYAVPGAIQADIGATMLRLPVQNSQPHMSWMGPYDR
ncbi:Polypyrimidine tract-binding protein-like protein 2 [Nymphaea thermarum]|nr:Polypyrimidine tract-binding protein-like protein 2 [Nymphaea thermarum]